MNIILRYEWRMFLRNKIAVSAWIILFVTGIYAIYYGRSFQAVQLDTVTRIDTAYQSRVKAQLDNFSADTTEKGGQAKYRNAHDPFRNELALRPMIWKSPGHLQALTIGQSDNQPFYYNIWVYNNVYNTKQVELRNPAKLLAGNFDLAFVFIYLIPLLIIAYSYNILSADVEAGISHIFSVQGISLQKILVARLLFRAMLIFSLIVSLSFIGFVLNAITDPYSILAWLGVISIYTCFWLMVVYAVNSAKKTGSINALMLVSIWVALLLVIPSTINNFQKSEDAGKLRIADADREYSNQLWAMSKKKIIDTLLQVKPAWKKYEVKDTNTWRSIAYSYLDMLNMNSIGRDIDEKAIREQQKLERLNFINPAFATQSLLNKIAGTELGDYTNFRKRASEYQLKRTELINSYRVGKKPFGKTDFQAFPVFNSIGGVVFNRDWLFGLLPLLVLSLICLIIGNAYWKKYLFIKNKRYGKFIGSL